MPKIEINGIKYDYSDDTGCDHGGFFLKLAIQRALISINGGGNTYEKFVCGRHGVNVFFDSGKITDIRIGAANRT